MATPLRPRPARSGGSVKAQRRSPSGLPREIEDEVRRAARPTQMPDAIARLGRAVELLERGDGGAAVREAEKAKEAAPRSAAVREVLGVALYREGRWRDSMTELKAYRRMTGRVDQNHLIADCLRGLGRPAEAVPFAEAELRGQAGDDAKAEAVIVAASALADQGRFAEALAFLGRARTREDVSEPYTLRLWYAKGDILARAGRLAEAAAEFRKVMRHDAAAFDAAERLAQLG